MRDFIKKLQEVHDITTGQEKAILKICGGVNVEFDKLKLKKSSNEAECQVSKFLELFFNARIRVLEIVMPLFYQSYVFGNIVDEFRSKNRIACTNDRFQCNLDKLLIRLKSDGVTVEEGLLKFLKVCEKMDTLGRNFQYAYGPSCHRNECSQRRDDSKDRLSSKIKRFINDFGSLLSDNFARFTNISQICEKTGNGLKNWRLKVD